MAIMSVPQRRWLVVFTLTLGVLIGAVLWSDTRLVSYRDSPFDFYAMKWGELFIVDGLTRRQEGSVKLGFAETHDPPEIGLYGNHVFRFFSSEAFGRPGDAAYFFNFQFANLALPEIYRYLLHIEQLGHLPKKLIVVQITSPNLDNGLFIINFGYELPPDLLLIGAKGDEWPEQISRFGAFAWEVAENWLHEILNYSTFILSFMQDGYGSRVIDPETCKPIQLEDAVPSLFRHAPWIVQNLLAISGLVKNYCQEDHWWPALRRDGSNDPRYLDKPLVKNQEPLNVSERGLNAGDEYEIVRQMRAIDAIGARHGIKVVFVVPPAFESNRDDSIVNQVFNRALAMIPDLAVVDNRDMHSDPSLFVDYLHPSPKYFRLLAAELRHRGFVHED
jgi:hypothetical protein